MGHPRAYLIRMICAYIEGSGPLWFLSRAIILAVVEWLYPAATPLVGGVIAGEAVVDISVDLYDRICSPRAVRSPLSTDDDFVFEVRTGRDVHVVWKTGLPNNTSAKNSLALQFIQAGNKIKRIGEQAYIRIGDGFITAICLKSGVCHLRYHLPLSAGNHPERIYTAELSANEVRKIFAACAQVLKQ